MELLLAAGLGAGATGKELFSYNRENYKWDQEQKLERETWRYEMQVKRFELFREDVRDLVNLTVDRMDIYHLIGAMFLSFCVYLFVEGRVDDAPAFVACLYLFSNASAFIYLLLAVWLSMHASIAAHSFGVRLLTRFVRLPIPSVKDLKNMTYHLQDFEQQESGNIMRLPFLSRTGQKWTNQEEIIANANQATTSTDGSATSLVPPRPGIAVIPPPVSSPVLGPSSDQNQRGGLESGCKDAKMRFGDAVAVGAPISADLDDARFPLEDIEDTTGGEDLLAGSHGATPGRHVQLFRELQVKWQCYDGYCRVCMSLGVNQILQGLSYYSICHSMVENESPVTGILLVVCFQTATVILAMLDLVGVRTCEIFTMQLAGILPCFITATSVGLRTGNLQERYAMAPVCFLLQVFWLELWLRVSAPASLKRPLPSRFRQVLFLDVFGDEDDNPLKLDDAGWLSKLQKMDRDASSKLGFAQCALRRWNACPPEIMVEDQCRRLAELMQRLQTSGQKLEDELMRVTEIGDIVTHTVFERKPIQWKELPAAKRRAEAFAGCLVGPFVAKDGSGRILHWDVEGERQLDENTPASACPGAFVLELPHVDSLIRDVEETARKMSTLRPTLIREKKAADHEPPPGSFMLNIPSGQTSRVRRLCCPNLFSMLRSRVVRWRRNNMPPAPAEPEISVMPISRTARTLVAQEAKRQEHRDNHGLGWDPALRAMAGQHARHFVPERLPWSVVYWMSRILQLSLLVAAVHFFFQEVATNVAKESENSPRLLAASWLSFEVLERTWPLGAMFNPRGLFTDPNRPDELIVSTPFAVYGSLSTNVHEQVVVELGKLFSPTPSLVLCAGGEAQMGPHPQSNIPANCSIASLGRDGASLRFSPLDFGPATRASSATVKTNIEGPSWNTLAGTIMRCQRLGVLNKRPAANHIDCDSTCLVLAGWSGQALVVTVDRLRDGVASIPDEIRPVAEIPVDPSQVGKGVLALHISGSVRLWALFGDGTLLAWNLKEMTRIARWKLDFTAVTGPNFQPTSIYDADTNGFFIIGRERHSGPMFLRSSVLAVTSHPQFDSFSDEPSSDICE